MQPNISSQVFNIDEFAKNNQDKTFLILESTLWTPHLETSLEIADVLREYSINVHHECFYLNSRVEDRWDLLRKVYRYISIKMLYLSFHKIKYEGFLSFAKSVIIQLKSLNGPSGIIKSSPEDIKDSIYSSAMSIFKSSDIDNKRYSHYEKKMIKSLKSFSKWTELCAKNFKPDYIILFNGRFATSRIIRRYCEKKNIQYIVHERGSSKNKYSLWLNSIPHNPKALQSSFIEFIKNSNMCTLDLAKAGEEFYAQRRKGNNIGWHSYMTDYESEDLKKLLQTKPNQKIVTYFTSTEDEFKALQQDLPPIGPLAEQINAIDAVKSVCDSFGLTFLLRLHPNLATRNSSERNKFPFEDYVIEPDDNVSSYALIKASVAVFTHNSQIALESAALKTPAAYTGRTRFEDLPCVYKCRNEYDIKSFLTKPVLNEENFQSCLFFGAYLQSFGIDYKYYRAKELNKGSYRGVNLNLPFGKISL